MSTTQQHLNQFYVELQAWIDGGCGEHPIFETWQGVCGNVHAWQSVKAPRYRSEWRLWDAVGEQFERAGFGDTCYPFAKSEREPHRYANPARLAWIKAHADAAKAAGQEAA